MRKKIFPAFISLLVTGSVLNAEIKPSTMEEMLDSVNLIQLGFLTNTNSLVQEGSKELKISSKQLSSIDNSKYLYFDEIKSYKYTKEKASKISIHSANLARHFKRGHLKKAHKEYSLLIDQCLECHQKLRDYVDRGESFRHKIN